MEEKALHMAGISRDENASPVSDEELLKLAQIAMKNSYSPYSHYATLGRMPVWLQTKAHLYLSQRLELFLDNMSQWKGKCLGLSTLAQKWASWRAA